MFEVDKYLLDVRPYASSYVTFGDGTKGKILGIGNLIKHGMPRLDNVLLMKGLTATCGYPKKKHTLPLVL